MKLIQRVAVRSLAVPVFALAFAGPLHAAVSNVAWYRFGENDSSAANSLAVPNTTTDLVGGNHSKQFNGPIYTSAVSSDASNRVGSSLAVNLNGVNQFFSNAVVSTAVDNFGIEAWVKPNSTDGLSTGIAYNGTSGNGWGLIQNGTEFSANYGGVNVFVLGPVAIGTWTHLALVRDNGTTRLYYNGTPAGTSSAVPNPPTTGFEIGARALPIFPEFFNGTIDEVRVFTFAPGQFSPNDLLFHLQRVSTLAASDVSSVQGTMNGSASPAGFPTTAWFEYGNTTNYSGATPKNPVAGGAGSTNFSWGIFGGTGGVTWHYRAAVSNSLGVAFGTNQSFTTFVFTDRQSALDGFDPNANGVVHAVVVQPDGKILIGGEFTTLAPNGGPVITRNRIARLNPDGTLDIAFNPNANAMVRTLALQADGKILVGGFFSGANSIGGQTRNYIARLNPVTGLADSFNPNANHVVYAIAVQADGKILVGGVFNSYNRTNSIGGQQRFHIARLDPATGLADSFAPNPDAFVTSIVAQPDGKVIASGYFSSIGGQPRNIIARLDPTTGLADAFNPNASEAVHAIALQADGKILVGGSFTNIGGQSRQYMARLDAVTGMADSFDPMATGPVSAIAVQADGRILVSGGFYGFNSIGGQTRYSMARLDPATGLADSFNPDAYGSALSMAVQPDGKIVVGGLIRAIAGQARNYIARLETDGGLDRTLNLNIVAGPFYEGVWATAVQPDGKIIIGGYFTNILGVARSNIARLNPDGTLDAAFNPDVNGTVFAVVVQEDGKILVGGAFTAIGGQPRFNIGRVDGTTGLPDSFNPNANNNWVTTIAVQADDRILVGGNFTIIGGQARNRIARLDPATGLADSFNPNANDQVYAIAVQPDGKILVGGDFNGFNSIGGTARNGIARLDAVTGLADLFNPGADNAVASIALQEDGRILVGGAFSSIGGAARNRIARLDPATGLADSFDPNANSLVYAIVVQANGKILVGGRFNGTNSIGGQTRNRLARLDPITGLADAFDPSVNNDVFSIAAQADGKMLIAGRFTNIGGQSRNRFARLSNDTAAQQNLVVTPGVITWTRGGSSPLFTRVTFEYSTDNANYTPLGSGTMAGSNWSLTDSTLNFPTGQNLYIRARGYYRSGYYSTSDSSIQESVRNVFFPPPPPRLNIQRSANMNVVLSWATNLPGFTLESKTNLNTNVWNIVSPAPVVSGTNHVVTNIVSGSARFYRLRK